METYKEPDRKAPRLSTFNNCLNLLEHSYWSNGKQKRTGKFYTQIKEDFPHLAKYSNYQIKRFIEGFNKEIVQTSIDHTDGVTLPSMCGTVMVCTFGFRKKGINRPASIKAGKKIYYDNIHSDGMGVGVYYSSQKVTDFNTQSIPMFKNSYYWCFNPVTSFSKKVSKAYRENWKKYRVLPRTRKLRDMDDSKYVYKKSRIDNEFDF